MRFHLHYLLIISFISSCYCPHKVKSTFNDPCENASINYPRTDKFYTSIHVFTKHYTGIVFVKSFSADSIFITFINEMGIKFFEFKIMKNQFHTVYSFNKLNKPKTESMIISNLRLLVEIIKIKPRIIPNYYKSMYSSLTEREIIIDSNQKILLKSSNTCLYSNKIWLINKSRKSFHGEYNLINQCIFTKNQILPIHFTFKPID